MLVRKFINTKIFYIRTLILPQKFRRYSWLTWPLDSHYISRQKWSHTKLVPRTAFVYQNRSAGPLLSVKSCPGRTSFVRQKWSYPHKSSPTRTTFAMPKRSYPDHFCNRKTVLFQNFNAFSSSDIKTRPFEAKQDITLQKLFFHITLIYMYYLRLVTGLI